MEIVTRFSSAMLEEITQIPNSLQASNLPIQSLRAIAIFTGVPSKLHPPLSK